MRTHFRVLREDWWTIIDASGTIDDVHSKCAAAADEAIQRCREGAELARLWD